jgi:GABA(A) receptor-associated protein
MWKYLIKNSPAPTKSGYDFKSQHSLERRKDESKRIREKYPDKIPIILEKGDTSLIPSIEKQKFLLQKDLTVGQYLYIIRKQIKLDPTESIFLLVNNTYIPSNSATLADIYTTHADEDGYLYITYSAQQVFG